jgi:hypothetical protein
MILMTDNHGERCCAVRTAPLRRAHCSRNEQYFTCDAFLHCNVTLSRVLERQLLRNRDLQPAISYRFGHVVDAPFSQRHQTVGNIMSIPFLGGPHRQFLCPWCGATRRT